MADSPLLTALDALYQAARRAYLAHAARPWVLGPAAEARRLAARAYEAKAALREQNPAFAGCLLPAAGGVPLDVPGPGLPLLPAAVRWAVDEDAPGTVSLALDVAGPLAVAVTGPDGTPAFFPVLTVAAGRTSCVFPAPDDGLYAVRLLAGGTPLLTVRVPVARAAFRRLRETSRALRFAFCVPAPQPAATSAHQQRLALLIAADAAAATGQPDLYAALMAAEAGVAVAPTPTALYPALHGD